MTDNVTKIFKLSCLISNLTKPFFAKLYKQICTLLLVIGRGYYINFQQYVSVICAISDCYYQGAEPTFSSSRPLLLSVPIPFPVAKRPPHIQLSGERRKLSGGGARPQTDNALCTSNTNRVFNRSQGQRGLLLQVLPYNVNVKVKK